MEINTPVFGLDTLTDALTLDGMPTLSQALYWLVVVSLGIGVAQLSGRLSQWVVGDDTSDDDPPDSDESSL
ncbi:MAG: hypothetical protein ACFE0J_02690 [Elainellaceae cyanobacterium]